MDLHERQQFDFLLYTAVDRFVTRLEQRKEGATHALAMLRGDATTAQVWIDEFVDAFFADFLLDNPAGACFVLQALSKRPAPAFPPARVEIALVALAKRVFAGLLAEKTEETLEQHAGYQAVGVDA
jgi:hypothetical protein